MVASLTLFIQEEIDETHAGGITAAEPCEGIGIVKPFPFLLERLGMLVGGREERSVRHAKRTLQPSLHALNERKTDMELRADFDLRFPSEESLCDLDAAREHHMLTRGEEMAEELLCRGVQEKGGGC